jgi:N-acetylmuramoyl-L-alanine amidase
MPRKTLLRTLAAVVVVAALLLAGQASFASNDSRRSVKVVWGDTLWALSRRYGVTMAQLAAANHMRVSDVLYAGRTLYLPLAKHATAGSTTGSGAKSTTSATRAPQATQQTFCSSYQPPTGPRGALPVALSSDPTRLALRPVFARWAKMYGVPLDLMEAEAWQESGWRNDVVSPAGAVGIGQLLPGTAVFVNQSLGTKLQLSVPSDNIRMMAAFLGYLLRATGGQVCGAVASYYQGLGTTQHYGVLPVSQVYVRDVLSLRPRFT